MAAAKTYEFVTVEREGPVTVVTLNRPERLNALNSEMREALARTWTDFRHSKELEVAIFTGTGRGFCAGEDMKETLQTGKRLVEIKGIEPVGHYAIRLVFSDGHDSGIYSWELLHEFCINRDRLWEEYLQKLEAAGFTREFGRDAEMIAQSGACSSH